jgi:GcrA cell cycle regulator
VHQLAFQLAARDSGFDLAARNGLMNWTDERVEMLKKLWADGLSASQIAAQLGGVTRNAVIGKVHRLKLSGRGKTTSSQPRAKKPVAAGASTTMARAAAPRASTSTAKVSSYTHAVGATALKAEYNPQAVTLTSRVLEFTAPLVAPVSRELRLVELSERTCKWPVGDPMSADFNFCGHESAGAAPYCAFHSKMAYQPASERRRAR